MICCIVSGEIGYIVRMKPQQGSRFGSIALKAYQNTTIVHLDHIPALLCPVIKSIRIKAGTVHCAEIIHIAAADWNIQVVTRQDVKPDALFPVGDPR